MNTPDIIQAWKDSKYRKSLSPEELRQLPENPAGEIALSDSELASIPGAQLPPQIWTAAWTATCCQPGTL